MRYAFAILSAIAVVAIAHETTILDESMDLLQESTTMELATAAHAKVAVKSEDSIKAKEGTKAALKERATVMIGTHELDAEEVSMAKHSLSKITMKLGVRHPIFLGEAAGISDFTSDKAKYVAGGYKVLKQILAKVDEFTIKLEDEKQNAVDDRERKYTECQEGQPAAFSAADQLRTQTKAAANNAQAADVNMVSSLRSDNQDLLAAETMKAAQLATNIGLVDAEYKAYWQTTEERHQVRNVLMQALWLVCTGFASFRHTEYCTNIRQQPDYGEVKTNDGKAEDMTMGQSLGDLNSLSKKSRQFGELMQTVWSAQKVADASSVNSLDGDVDMEKGFVNNRAPWGVDSQGMDDRATSDKTADVPAELGESNEAGAHDMTNEEMSSRLTFLVESSSVPERISVPITAFIQALDSDDTAVQGGLVEALVKMDTAEGQAQSNIDYGWYNTMISKRDIMHKTLVEAQDMKKESLDNVRRMEAKHADMVTRTNEEIRSLAQFDLAVESAGEDGTECDNKIIELEALIEVCNEELTNIMRLNSLLRYLVVGAKEKCEQSDFDCVTPEGSCTWVNRGSATITESDEVGVGCEDEAGTDIPCNYNDAYDPEGTTQPREDENQLTFCACEYGYFGDTNKMCNKKSCPGFGRIRYPGNDIVALRFKDVGIAPSYAKYNPSKGAYGGDTKYSPNAVCSGRKLEMHGECDFDEGKCTQCYVTRPLAGASEELGEDPEDPRTPELVRQNGLVTVPSWVRRPMPFSGEKLKCEEYFVVGKPVAANEPGAFQFTTEADPAAMCDGIGQPRRNAAGMATGGCICPEDRFGQACEYMKCQMDNDEGAYYEPNSPVACSGRGVCDPSTGKCTACSFATGDYCEEKRCPGYDVNEFTSTITDPECGAGVGLCDVKTGRCVCAQGASCGINGEPQCPGACIYEDCQANCQAGSTDGGSSGLCDRFSGLCMCDPSGVFNGPACLTPMRGGPDQKGQVESMVWTSTMDKWGWSTCNDGYLLTGMKTDLSGSSDALFNLDRGICQRPFEANAEITRAVENYRCYHENWWKKFDSRGGKFCRRNYFVAGLFRSHCNSLYCIEMAKCCSVKRSLWTACKWVSTKSWTQNAAGMTVSQGTGFIVGFFRDQLHTLAGITSLRQCTPIWYGQLYKYKTRFDN